MVRSCDINSGESADSMATFVPSQMNEITPKWFASLETETSGLPSVVKCRVKVFPEGLSATGKLARIHLNYPEGTAGPESLIAKMPDPMKATSATAATFEREIRFYQELGPNIGIRIPRMYFGESDGEKAIMLLEDLDPLEPGDSLLGCDLDGGKAAIKALAGIHSEYWGRDEIGSLPWLWNPTASMTPAQQADLIDEGWNALSEEYRGHLSPSARKIGESRRWFEQLVGFYKTGKKTLTHPDFRLDNLFFDPVRPTTPCAVIDWGRVTWDRPGFALAFLLASESGLTSSEIEECLDTYLDSLVSGGVTGFGMSDCLLEFRVGVLRMFSFRLWQSAVGAQSNVDTRIVEMRLRGWRQILTAIDEFDCLGALNSLPGA